MLLGLDVRNFCEHALELLPAATGCTLSDINVRIQHCDLLGESGSDELIEWDPIVLCKHFCTAAK
jgi:hypothetical protein